MDCRNIPSCPFCDFVEEDSYFLTLHVETVHPETGVSPFSVRETSQHSSNVPQPKETIVKGLFTPAPTASFDQDGYVPCPHGCGEQIARRELAIHADFHTAEAMAFEDAVISSQSDISKNLNSDNEALVDISNHSFKGHLASPKSSRRARQSSRSSRGSTRGKDSLKDLLLGKSRSPTQKSTPPVHSQLLSNGRTKRLGRSELGPYAHEEQMPSGLRKMLEEKSKVMVSNKINSDGSLVRVETVANETPDLIPILARLSDADPTITRAYYCRPEVRHVSKFPEEGGFCGYRNIQMMISYIRDAKSTGHENFPGRIPSIFRVQDMIEQAWVMGFNSSGKVETGGVRGTRKYIGTPEVGRPFITIICTADLFHQAQAVFLSLGIPCEANAFTDTSEVNASEILLMAVGEYFLHDKIKDASNEKVTITQIPPLYFQHHGHSMTIVGIEISTSGLWNLVVFDPMFRPSKAIRNLANAKSIKHLDLARLMKLYRRGEEHLARYKNFEILKLI